MGLSFLVYSIRLVRILRVTQHRPPTAIDEEVDRDGEGDALDARDTIPSEQEEKAKSIR